MLITMFPPPARYRLKTHWYSWLVHSLPKPLWEAWRAVIQPSLVCML